MAENTKKISNAVIFIIFGGTGDLAIRKIIPALYNLYLDDWLPEQFAIIGSSSSKMSEAKYRENLLNGVNEFSRKGKAKKEDWQRFAEHISFQQADISDHKSFSSFGALISKHTELYDTVPTVLYYCAVAPHFFGSIAENIAKAKLENTPATTRIIVEKPFGSDLKSAMELNKKLLAIFEEKQIYRIDHYLGKEVVQNLMAFRFANAIIEPLWHRNQIEHVQISVTEQIGVGLRGKYFEHAGALRDMVQNHLMQLLCIIAMEPPINFDADEIRNRKVDVLRAIRRIAPYQVASMSARGQYGAGWLEGNEVQGYREEAQVATASNTETYAALKLHIDNWRWQGVPFYLRTGKRLFKTASVITIQFKEVPHNIFQNKESGPLAQNRLVISIQPDMSIRFQVQSKAPGLEMILNTVDMVFNYSEKRKAATPEAYETLLLDAIEGDQTLFMRADQVEEAWALIMPILNYWEQNKAADFPNYTASSWGPENAEALIAKDGYHWFNLPDQNTSEQ